MIQEVRDHLLCPNLSPISSQCMPIFICYQTFSELSDTFLVDSKLLLDANNLSFNISFVKRCLKDVPCAPVEAIPEDLNEALDFHSIQLTLSFDSFSFGFLMLNDGHAKFIYDIMLVCEELLLLLFRDADRFNKIGDINHQMVSFVDGLAA